jgi:CIC family chloride channel protein
LKPSSNVSGATVAAPPKPLVDAQALSLRPDQLEYLEQILLAVAIGVLAALGNLGFRSLIEFFSWIFRTLEWKALGIREGSLTVLLIPIILMSGGAAILILNYFFPGDVLGYGFPNFLEMVNLGQGRIKRRWIVVKALGAALSLGAGASVGREGPIAQIGGAIGSAVAQARRFSVDRAKVLIAAGAGAGIATTFNAPMGGLMFAQEIVLMGQTDLTNVVLVVIATFTAVVTSRTMMGQASAVFHPATFAFTSYWEMFSYGVMGAVLGLLGAWYIKFFHRVGHYIREIKLPQWAKLTIGLGIVGVIAIVLPKNLSDGYPVIDLALNGKLGIAMLLALAAAKFVASTISLDCGTPGGVFGPVFFIGAMSGGAFRGFIALVAPGIVGPRGSYSLIGLGAFLAAVTHAPLTALFLLFEMTQLNYNVALPAMITTITALVVARSIESESIDTYALAREGKTLAIGKERLVLSQLPVASVMHKEVDVLSENATLADVLRRAGETAQATIPVVNSAGELAGLIVTHDLLGVLASGADLGALVNAFDLARRNPPVVTPESNLDQAAQMMEYEALDEIPVVEHAHGGRFLGLISRSNVALAFNRVTVSLSAQETGDRGIFWATGYRVSRLEIPAGAVGKTIRQLDPRARYSVSVLAIQDAGDPESGFAPLGPDRALKPGDLIVAAGRPADLRRFIRDLDGG